MAQLSWTRRSALSGLAAAVLIAVPACGSVRAGAHASASSRPAAPSARLGAVSRAGGAPEDALGPALCADLGQVDRVVVARTAGVAQGRSRAAQPGTVTVADPLKARALARALCALASPPHLPQLNCPIDFGGSLRLAFSAPARRFPLVTVKTSGCRTVTGLGPPRLAGTVFWRTVSLVLGPQRIAGAPAG